MHNMYLSKAIKKLKPNSEYSFTEEDYSSIQWFKIEGDAPTKKQIDDAINQIKADEITEAQAKASAKAALLDKLGISEDEAKLLLN